MWHDVTCEEHIWDEPLIEVGGVWKWNGALCKGSVPKNHGLSISWLTKFLLRATNWGRP
jgi:hypothetical protein